MFATTTTDLQNAFSFKYEGKTLEDYQGMLDYVNEQLTYNLEAWERKEYNQLVAQYEFAINDIKLRMSYESSIR
jgi:hypothetical protein